MLVFPPSPVRNPHVNAVAAKQIFAPEDIERVRRAVSDKSWQPGMAGALGAAAANFVNQPIVRQMMQQPVKVNKEGFPLNPIVTEICSLNSIAWQFKLCGIVDDDMPWIMRYRHGGDHYDWHVDIGHEVNGSRKLSFTLQLSASSDYDGGDLEFLNASYDREALRQPGTIAVFPAYFAHRVTPVTRGERLALVGWMHGDSYT